MSKDSRSGPDFIVVGQMKCATTSLYGSFCASPRFVPVEQKEIHFFTFQSSYAAGIKTYEAYFPRRRPGQLTAEASPSYFNEPTAAPRIFKHYPDVKLIVCLRNPGTRAISHYYHEVKRGFETRSLEEVFADSNTFFDNGYVASSLYAPKLAWFLQIFPPEQISIFVFESFVMRPEQTLEGIFSFVDLDMPENMPVYNLSASSPKNFDSKHQILVKNINEYAKYTTEWLSTMVRKSGVHVAGDLNDLMLDSKSALARGGDAGRNAKPRGERKLGRRVALRRTRRV